jgi:hypothetical protein
MKISVRGKRFKFSRNSCKFQYPWPSPGRVEQHTENTISVHRVSNMSVPVQESYVIA